jgi:hypothetical protein
MAETRDPQLSQHYRDLEPLEPPGELDQAILAAAQRAAAPRRRRWYYSLAAAAVLVFAVALTLQIEHERPDAESASQDGASRLRLSRELRGEIKPAERPAESKPAKVAPPSAETNLAPAASAPAAPARRADAAPTRSEARNAEATAPAPAPPPEPAIQLRREMAIAPQYAPAPPAAQSAMQSAAPAAARESPERWLDRIAELRSRGRHAEADKELAEFRRTYPNYRLSDLMRQRVEGR